MDDPKNSPIISKRMNRRYTRRRKTFRPLQKDIRKTNCTEILSSPSVVSKNILNIWTRSWQLISHTQLLGKSVSNMRTTGVNGRGPKSGPMKKRADHPQAAKQTSGSEKTSGESKSVYP